MFISLVFELEIDIHCMWDTVSIRGEKWQLNEIYSLETTSHPWLRIIQRRIFCHWPLGWNAWWKGVSLILSCSIRCYHHFLWQRLLTYQTIRIQDLDWYVSIVSAFYRPLFGGLWLFRRAPWKRSKRSCQWKVKNTESHLKTHRLQKLE